MLHFIAQKTLFCWTRLRTMQLISGIGWAVLLLSAPLPAEEIAFVEQIQSIFREKCWDCHGEETSEAGLRLDQKRDALAGGDTGRVIVSGDPQASVLLDVVSGADPDRIMPPDGDPLTPEEVALLRTWIQQGADWPNGVDPERAAPTHWAFQPIQIPQLDSGADAAHPIDQLVNSRLREAGLTPSPEADRFTLIKRLYYDLLGLPPTPEEVDQFINDTTPQAYERLVDRLLQSPHFGERWGRHWLDMARYADSDGYEKDRPRFHAWKYRDWVIQAVNDDMPFDQFTIEQLAGDLLPEPTESQLLATAFHRQTLTNTEGGTDQEEFRVAAVMDRVETLGTVWLGLTLGCARCHSHKYDPIPQREYYQLFAFLNNGDEVNATLASSTDAWAAYETQKADFDRRLSELMSPLDAARASIRPTFPDWEARQRERIAAIEAAEQKEVVAAFESAQSEGEATLTRLEDGSYLSSGTRPETDVYVLQAQLAEIASQQQPLSAIRLDVLKDETLPKQGPGRADNGNFVLSEITLDIGTPEGMNQRRKFASAQADFSQTGYEVAQAIDGKEDTKGWAVSPQMGRDHAATFSLQAPLTEWTEQTSLTLRLSQQYTSQTLAPHLLGRFRITFLFGESLESLGLPEHIRSLLAIESAQQNDKQQKELFDFFAKQNAEIQALQAKVDEFKKQAPFKPEMTVRVIRERKQGRRTTHVFKRGSFLDPLGPVQPDTFGVLHRSPEIKDRAPNRLDLATWLVSPENPLTPRVTANQIWSHLFGDGLVKTMNDFGVRGESPTHPKLLDWLAAELIDQGWSRKAFIKSIVLSQTYRQSSVHRSELSAADPQNMLLARQNRFRMEAEIIRDLYLAASGLLERRIGGPSVFPPLPPGIAELSYANNFKWGNSEWNSRPDRPHGVAPKDDIYRRGMYTFFKRTAAHPNLVTFDCPDSNTTCVSRNTSNTPLQALQTLNNHVFLNASRALADRATFYSDDDADRLTYLVRLCVARPPSSDEIRTLEGLLGDARSYYELHPTEGEKLEGTGEQKASTASAEWIAVARIVMNLDEFITRE